MVLDFIFSLSFFSLILFFFLKSLHILSFLSLSLSLSHARFHIMHLCHSLFYIYLLYFTSIYLYFTSIYYLFVFIYLYLSFLHAHFKSIVYHIIYRFAYRLHFFLSVIFINTRNFSLFRFACLSLYKNAQPYRCSLSLSLSFSCLHFYVFNDIFIQTEKNISQSKS